MHRRVVNIAADCCLIHVSKGDADFLKVVEGGELASATSVPVTIRDSGQDAGNPRKSAGATFATWKSRWLLMVTPSGRGTLFEYTRNRLTLSSTFDCPVNTSAVLILDDEVEDCALVAFGTDEGPRASKVHVARLTFSTESLSVKPLRIWGCTGSVSSLARFSDHLVLVGYSSCEGVGLFDAFAFDDPSSPTLGLRQRSAPRVMDKLDVIQTRSTGEMLPVWVSSNGSKILTLTHCGTLNIHNEHMLDNADWTIYLGFDCLGMSSLPTVDGVVICGWRGETAMVDINSGQVSRFMRTKDTARVEDFAIMVSSDSRLLLVHVDADEGDAVKVFDFGRAALLGSSQAPVGDFGRSTSTVEDDLVYVGSDDAGFTGDDSEAKALVRDAWEQLMMEES